MRCGHAADASLAPTETPDIVCGTDFRRHRGQVGAVGWSAQAGVCAGLVSSVLVLMPGLLCRDDPKVCRRWLRDRPAPRQH
jgi:hypothetical protein